MIVSLAYFPLDNTLFHLEEGNGETLILLAQDGTMV